MSATFASVTDFPPTRDELAVTAQAEVRGAFAGLSAPDADIAPFILIAGPRTGGAALRVPLPAIRDTRAKVRVACRFIPYVLLAHEATACALVLTSWSAPSSQSEGVYLTPSEHPDRRELVVVQACEQRSDAARLAWIRRRQGLPPRLGAWERCGSEGGLFAHAIHAALGRYSPDALSATAPRCARLLFAVRVDVAIDDAVAERLAMALATQPWQVGPPVIRRAVVAGETLTVCVPWSDADADTARAVFASTGFEVVDLSPDDLGAVLVQEALVFPLLDAGYSPHQIIDGLRLEPEEAALLGEGVAVPSWRKVGRNDRCPCGSGRKAKRCCHA